LINKIKVIKEGSTNEDNFTNDEKKKLKEYKKNLKELFLKKNVIVEYDPVDRLNRP